ncbi:MAG: lipopolysaccharide transport periplasmic protein LptA [Desulfobacteraceae bacterium]|nr:MAG: lipopolysaccharide transport periplasmic protein LptA [Desulfobacteraceae bacterium]
MRQLSLYFLNMIPVVLAVCVGFFAVAGTAHGVPATGADTPIHIEADRMESDPGRDCLLFSGHVHAKQADLVIDGEEMTVFYAGEEKGKKNAADRQIRKIVATGNVKITKAAWVATGDAMEYVAAEGSVLLTGDAKVWQGDNLVEGQRIAVDLEEGKTVVERGDAARVKAFIYPEKAE